MSRICCVIMLGLLASLCFNIDATNSKQARNDINLGPDPGFDCDNPFQSTMPHPHYCYLYYLCGEGYPTPFLYQCDNVTYSQQLMFNLAYYGCDFASQTPCGDRLSEEFKCPTANGRFPLNHSACSPYYFTCSSSVSYPEKCAANSIFDPSTGVCTSSPSCNPPSTAAPFTTTTKIPGTPGNFQCPGDGLFANPDDCSTFWQCIGGIPFLQECPPGLLWNDYAQYCDFPSNVNCNNIKF